MAPVLEPSIARGREPEGSDRNFGLVFAAVFAIIGCWPVVGLAAPRWWALGVAVAFASAALLWPHTLRPFNRAWLWIGRLMHKVVSPVAMGVIFFLCVTPIALIMRLRGSDVLSLKRRPDLESYWIRRGPSTPPTESMKQQF